MARKIKSENLPRDSSCDYMSSSSTNLDSPDALHAFRLAMGLESPRDSADRVEAAEISDSTDSDFKGGLEARKIYSCSNILNQDLATGTLLMATEG